MPSSTRTSCLLGLHTWQDAATLCQGFSQSYCYEPEWNAVYFLHDQLFSVSAVVSAPFTTLCALTKFWSCWAAHLSHNLSSAVVKNAHATDTYA